MRYDWLLRLVARSYWLIRLVPRCDWLLRLVPRCDWLFRLVPRCDWLNRQVAHYTFVRLGGITELEERESENGESDTSALPEIVRSVVLSDFFPAGFRTWSFPICRIYCRSILKIGSESFELGRTVFIN